MAEILPMLNTSNLSSNWYSVDSIVLIWFSLYMYNVAVMYDRLRISKSGHVLSSFFVMNSVYILIDPNLNLYMYYFIVLKRQDNAVLCRRIKNTLIHVFYFQ